MEAYHRTPHKGLYQESAPERTALRGKIFFVKKEDLGLWAGPHQITGDPLLLL